MDDAQLRTVWQQRQMNDRVSHLSHSLTVLMKKTLSKRVKQLGKIAAAWDELIPDAIREHTALESYARGVLTVMVDSAPHRFQLQTMLSGGLQAELQQRVKTPINKIKLVPGQFYSVDLAGEARYEF